MTLSNSLLNNVLSINEMHKVLLLLPLFLLSLCFYNAEARERSWAFPIGAVFYEAADGVQYAIPFAVVCVYDSVASDRLEGIYVCNYNGEFRATDYYDYTHPKLVKVWAPGFKEASCYFESFDPSDRSFTGGNFTHCISLSPSNGASVDVTKPVFKHKRVVLSSFLSEHKSVRTVSDVIENITGAKETDGVLKTSDGKPVRVQLQHHEFALPPYYPDLYSHFDDISLENIYAVDFFFLCDDNAIFSVIVDLVMNPNDQLHDYDLVFFGRGFKTLGGIHDCE